VGVLAVQDGQSAQVIDLAEPAAPHVRVGGVGPRRIVGRPVVGAADAELGAYLVRVLDEEVGGDGLGLADHGEFEARLVHRRAEHLLRLFEVEEQVLDVGVGLDEGAFHLADLGEQDLLFVGCVQRVDI